MIQKVIQNSPKISGLFSQYAVIEVEVPSIELQNKMFRDVDGILRENEVFSSTSTIVNQFDPEKRDYAHYARDWGSNNKKQHIFGYFCLDGGDLRFDYDVGYPRYDSDDPDIQTVESVKFNVDGHPDFIKLQFVLGYKPSKKELNDFWGIYIDKDDIIKNYYQTRNKEHIVLDLMGDPLQYKIIKIYRYNKE